VPRHGHGAAGGHGRQGQRDPGTVPAHRAQAHTGSRRRRRGGARGAGRGRGRRGREPRAVPSAEQAVPRAQARPPHRRAGVAQVWRAAAREAEESLYAVPASPVRGGDHGGACVRGRPRQCASPTGECECRRHREGGGGGDRGGEGRPRGARPAAEAAGAQGHITAGGAPGVVCHPRRVHPPHRRRGLHRRRRLEDGGSGGGGAGGRRAPGGGLRLRQPRPARERRVQGDGGAARVPVARRRGCHVEEDQRGGGAGGSGPVLSAGLVRGVHMHGKDRVGGRREGHLHRCTLRRQPAAVRVQRLPLRLEVPHRRRRRRRIRWAQLRGD
jgi:hypothetical protein